MKIAITLAFLACVTGAAALFGSTQSVAVTGTLLCNGKPAQGVKVVLVEKDKIYNDKLDKGKTDNNGRFYLSGKDKEITKIDPRVDITHGCHTGICNAKFGITIPDDYITKGSVPKKTFDIGTLNLEGKFPGQKTKCF